MNSTIEILKKLVLINSINPFKMKKINPEDPTTWKLYGNEEEIIDYLETILKQNGFITSRQFVHESPDGKKYYNLLAEKGGGRNSILFYGHMDTVTTTPWKSMNEALTPRIEGRQIDGEKKEVLIGLGANDMKSGLAVMANAFKYIEPNDYKIKLAFGVDEEYYSLGSNALIKDNFLDDVKAIIVPEIGDGPNKTYGPQTIGLGRLGRCEFEIKVYGTGGHGAQSDNPNFISAVDECAKIAIEIINRKKTFTDKYIFSEIGIKNDKNEINGSYFVSRMESGGGSLSIPANGSLIVDWTFTPNFTIRQGSEYLEKMINEMYKKGDLRKVVVSGEFKKIEVLTRKRPTSASDAYGVSANHPFTTFVKKVIDENLGFKNYNFGYSVADENVFKRAKPEIPLLVIGPRGDNSHMADEWVDIESVLDLEKLYQDIVNNFKDYIVLGGRG